MAYYWLYAAVIYGVFVIYGSLVPLDYQPLTWQQALDTFKNTPYLALGIESRADWIANSVLYIPLAFLWMMVLGHTPSFTVRIVWMLLVLMACIAVAIAIEFCQLYFPPRTVSLNDLLAESIGILIGIGLAVTGGQRLLTLINSLSLGAVLSFKLLIQFYVLSYFMLSFFPFDVVTSFAELDSKLDSGQDNIFMSQAVCQQEVLRCFIKLIVEILVLMPLGGLFYLLPHVLHKRALAILAGFFIGVFSELVQLFLYSGIAQGISILTRMLGMGLGVMAAHWLSQQHITHWQTRLRPGVLIAIVFYIPLLFVINGGLAGTWLSLELVRVKLAETQFLPFFYFYYTTETVALVSFISNVGMYMPIGILYGLWGYASTEDKTFSWLWVGGSAMVLALMVETEKLFLVNKHADPTDVSIAFIAAVASYCVTNHLLHVFHRSQYAVPLKQRV